MCNDYQKNQVMENSIETVLYSLSQIINYQLLPNLFNKTKKKTITKS